MYLEKSKRLLITDFKNALDASSPQQMATSDSCNPTEVKHQHDS